MSVSSIEHWQTSIYSEEMERFITYFNSSQQHENLVISEIVRIYQTNNLFISDNNHDGIESKFEKVE